jgi:hypothetical protein
MPTTKPEQIVVDAMKNIDENFVASLKAKDLMMIADHHHHGVTVDTVVGNGNNHNDRKVVIVDDNDFVNNNYQDLHYNDDDNDNVKTMMMTMMRMMKMQMSPEDYQQQQMQLFENVNGLTLHMEALTLEAEGSRRMELLQNDIRPIFTIQCQLSSELIKNLPKQQQQEQLEQDQFVMTFESEKFQNSTQCARFGQEIERKIQISMNNQQDPFEKMLLQQQHANNNDNDDNNLNLPNLGRLHFIVWWREPGTCLNEMLGMGVLHLNQLYNDNLLEQCKCIMIQRRNIQLAKLYFKISLQLAAVKPQPNILLQQQQQQQYQLSTSCSFDHLKVQKLLNQHHDNNDEITTSAPPPPIDTKIQ